MLAISMVFSSGWMLMLRNSQLMASRLDFEVNVSLIGDQELTRICCRDMVLSFFGIVVCAETNEICGEKCERVSLSCVAWTGVAESLECYISLWMTLGKAAHGKLSGINARQAMKLASKCM